MSRNKNTLCDSHLFPKGSLFQFLNKNFSVEFINFKILSQCAEYKKYFHTHPKKLNSYDDRIVFIAQTIKNGFEVLKSSLKKSETNITNDQAAIFIVYLDEYFEHISFTLKEKYSTILRKSDVLRDVSNENDANILKINNLNFQLSKMISEFNEKCCKKEERIANIIKQGEKYKEQSAVKITNETYDGNIKIIKKLKARWEIEEKLILNEKLAKNKYQKLLDENIINQKRLIEQKLKAEQALEAILLKFDNDIGSRVSEMESIEGEMNEEKQKFEEWKSTIFTQQEADYTKLMQEKEDEEKFYRDQKLEEIKHTHAAKVIQVGWKKYKIKQKKALKKNKKKDAPKRAK